MKLRSSCLLLLCLFSGGACYSQAETFARAVFEAVQEEDYDRLEDLWIPAEQMIRIMHWSQDSASYSTIDSLLVIMNDSFSEMGRTMKDKLSQAEIDFNEAIYSGYTYSNQHFSMTIRFTSIQGIDSFSIGITKTDQLYLLGSLEYPVKGSSILPGEAIQNDLNRIPVGRNIQDLHADVLIRYDEVMTAISDHEGLDPSKKRVLSDSTKIIFRKYEDLLDSISTHLAYFETRLYEGDPKTGELLPKTDMVVNHHYWQEKGHASQLKDQLESFVSTIVLVNRMTGSQFSGLEIYLPFSLTDLPEFVEPNINWETYTFEGPVVANVANLEAIKLDLAEIMSQELDFLEEVISFR